MNAPEAGSFGVMSLEGQALRGPQVSAQGGHENLCSPSSGNRTSNTWLRAPAPGAGRARPPWVLSKPAGASELRRGGESRDRGTAHTRTSVWEPLPTLGGVPPPRPWGDGAALTGGRSHANGWSGVTFLPNPWTLKTESYLAYLFVPTAWHAAAAKTCRPATLAAGPGKPKRPRPGIPGGACLLRSVARFGIPGGAREADPVVRPGPLKGPSVLP